MKRSTRTLLMLILVEIIIIGGGLYLANDSRNWTPPAGETAADTVAYIYQMTGMIAGALGGLLLVVFIAQWLREKRGN